MQQAVEIARSIEDGKQIVMLENMQWFTAEQRRLRKFDGLSLVFAHASR